MSVYNGERFLSKAIDSVLSQTYNDFEFIIVNDASTDHSDDIIRGFSDGRIRVINNDRNMGLTRSLNIALKKAKGEYIARQDDDDISMSNRFEKQIGFFEKHEEIKVLGTGASIIGAEGRIIINNICYRNPGSLIWKYNPIIHGSVMFNKEIIDLVGKYNEMFVYSQDYDLWLRAHKSYKIDNLYDPLYQLRIHNTSISSRKTEEQVLYDILAKMINDNESNDDIIKKVTEGGISSLKHELNLRQKLYLQKKNILAHLKLMAVNKELIGRSVKYLYY